MIYNFNQIKMILTTAFEKVAEQKTINCFKICFFRLFIYGDIRMAQ